MDRFRKINAMLLWGLKLDWRPWRPMYKVFADFTSLLTYPNPERKEGTVVGDAHYPAPTILMLMENKS